MSSRILSANPMGIGGVSVIVEAAVENGAPLMHLIGLPGKTVRESRDRIRMAVKGFGYELPRRRLVVHLHPAAQPKQGSHLDLAIAVAALQAEGHLTPPSTRGIAFLGELGLDGSLEEVSGVLSLVDTLLKDSQVEKVVIPMANAGDVAPLKSPDIHCASHLGEVLDFLMVDRPLESPPTPFVSKQPPGSEPLLDRIIGQRLAKRALQIAVAGEHHLVLVGPPGVGKSMLAKAAVELLPPLSGSEQVEVAKSFTGFEEQMPKWGMRPYREPHHSISMAALLGGGSGTVVQGEVTLAHRGILFLDEFPEFRKDVIEGLREPLQAGSVNIHRLGCHLQLPARFILIVAMNPCPCGYAIPSPPKPCRCGPEKVSRYRSRISGPIWDRTDLFCVLGWTEEPSQSRLSFKETFEGISQARRRQLERFNDEGMTNGRWVAQGQRDLLMNKAAEAWLENKIEQEFLSYRGRFRLEAVARTIADLGGREAIEIRDFEEAWLFRRPDRWGY